MRTITIVVEGGCVVEVENLPDDWYYEIDDRDIEECHDGLIYVGSGGWVTPQIKPNHEEEAAPTPYSDFLDFLEERGEK